DKEMPLLECGLYNLTQDSLSVLIHLDQDRTLSRQLIRLEPPAEEAPEEEPPAEEPSEEQATP
ncbi:MAG: hypothetical protein MI861_23315, partial [Pirellulales bacterium]|nr:hypothetical protein [Pirellulales bacterium]